MTKAAKIVLPLFLLAAAAGGVAYYLNSSQPEPTPVATAPSAPAKPVDPAPVAPAVAPPVVTPPPQEPIRTEAGAMGDTHADALQGVRGRVIQPDGTPAAGVPVMLIENLSNDAIRIFLVNRTAKTTIPIASGATAADGTFALGVTQPGKPCDLRIVSDTHPEKNLANLKVRAGDWYDAGVLKLDLGLVVQGRVLEEGSLAPVPGATVYLASSTQSHAMITTPGRERGVVATTDERGQFRFTNAPAQGLVNLTVEATGFASSPMLNQQLKPEGPNEFTFQVVPGQPIAGVVVDPDGKPIPGATVNATGLSSKTPQNATTVSGADGSFQFPSLRAGPYHVQSSMPQYTDAKQSPVMTGDTQVKLVLGTRATVKLRVLAANGSPVKTYRISLMRYCPNHPAGVGKVIDFPDRNVNPGDYPAEFDGEWAVIRGLPPGDFRIQVQDNAHAKTLSSPFTVVEGGPVAETVAQLTLGATITGTVMDDKGKPVADATVSTDLNGGPAADLGILELFKTMMPERHTKSQVKTDAQGRFRIAKLAFADYMVRVSHPDYCEGAALDIKLETAGQVVDVGVIQLSLGAVVEGVTMVAGQPAGQIKITVSTPFTDQMNQKDAVGKPLQAMFHANVISDGDGRFRLMKRVPPGVYKINASRQGGENPFFAIVDMKDTEQQLTISPGQDRVTLQFNLSKR